MYCDPRTLIAVGLLGLALSSPVRGQTANNNNLYGTDSFIQSTERFNIKDNFRPLDLTTAIEQSLRENPSQKVREVQTELLDVQWEGAKIGFWFPEIKLELSSQEQRVAKLFNGNKNNNPRSKDTGGTLGLSLGNYTVFNWGKDYLAYANKRETYNRGRANLGFQRLALRHQVIKDYFELLTVKKIEEINKEFLRHASYVYRLSTEKLSQGKINRQEYLQSRALYLEAQQAFHQAQLTAQAMDEKVALQLGDPMGTRYVIREAIDYRELKIPSEEALTLAAKNNFDIVNSETQLGIAERNYEVARKENLPLPKFTVDLGAYTKRFGQGQGSTRYETAPGNSDVEVVAVVNATWDLWGEDGFFNSRKLTRNYLSQGVSQMELERSKRTTANDIRQQYLKVLNYQKQILILDARVNNQQKTFDASLDNYLNKRTPFINYGQALTQLIESQVQLAGFRFQHVYEKVGLATEIGIDDFPGEYFEKLAVKNEK